MADLKAIIYTTYGVRIDAQLLYRYVKRGKIPFRRGKNTNSVRYPLHNTLRVLEEGHLGRKREKTEAERRADNERMAKARLAYARKALAAYHGGVPTSIDPT